jgi:hypothetical protein
LGEIYLSAVGRSQCDLRFSQIICDRHHCSARHVLACSRGEEEDFSTNAGKASAMSALVMESVQRIIPRILFTPFLSRSGK